MPSKQVVDRQKSAQAVVAAAQTHAARVGEAVAKALPTGKKGEEKAATEKLIGLAAAGLAEAAAAMVAADEAHLSELSDDNGPREARDAAAAALAEEIVSLREWVTGLYGSKAGRALGFSDQTPRDATALARFAGEISAALRNATLPAPRRKGVKWAAAEAADTLDGLRAPLESALAKVALEAREAQATLADKAAAIDRYDDVFRRVAMFLVGVFTLAGETALADRVRPSSRRPGQTEELEAPAEPTVAPAPNPG
ncbi:MAG: hypothetical protein R3F14_38395 [Polyangiaceae bacterium]